MSAENTQGEGNTPVLSAEEQASVEVGQRGFSEPANPNVIPSNEPARPDWLPEKFFKEGKPDYEALARSYGELESKQGAAPAAAPAADPAAAPAADPATDANGKIVAAPAGEPAETPLAKAIALASTDYASTQAFSDETATALTEAGIPPEIQKIYLDGLAAQAEKATNTIFGYAGGEAAYNEMAAWARQNLTDAELDAYNNSLDNPDLRENAVLGLHARFSKARPSEGQLVTPSGGAAAAGDVYQSKDDLLSDQRDPRYQTDAKFRQGVMDKLARSQAAGFQMHSRPMFERTIINS